MATDVQQPESSTAQPVQYTGWDEKGTPIVLPTPKADSAPAATPAKAAEKSETAPTSETGKESTQEPKHPSKAESRIKELLAEKKSLDYLELNQSGAAPAPEKK
jgi:hypothetical protein